MVIDVDMLKINNKEITDWESHDYDGSSDRIWYRALSNQKYMHILSVHKVYQDNFCHIEFGSDPLKLRKVITPDIWTTDIEQAKSIIDNILLRLSKLETFT